jgi:hypothetical protein
MITSISRVSNRDEKTNGEEESMVCRWTKGSSCLSSRRRFKIPVVSQMLLSSPVAVYFPGRRSAYSEMGARFILKSKQVDSACLDAHSEVSDRRRNTRESKSFFLSRTDSRAS